MPSSAGTAVGAPRLALDRHANRGQLREHRKRYKKAQGERSPTKTISYRSGLNFLSFVCRGGRSQHERKTRYAQPEISCAAAPGAPARPREIAAGLNFLSFQAFCRARWLIPNNSSKVKQQDRALTLNNW